MESNLSSRNLLPGGLGYVGFDLQGSMRVNDNQQHPHSVQQPHHCLGRQGMVPLMPVHEAFPLTMGQSHQSDKVNFVVDYNKVEKANHSPSDEDENNCNEGAVDGQSDPSKGKKGPWQRVKWADSMVRLLITAVSYLDEDAVGESGLSGRRKLSALHKKGKWKLASKVMGERGFYVSPQQCEDKFNDLNKRYKKLNEILGRGTSCQVVEKPALLDLMDHLHDKTKDEVRKILSSKQLFYEEMCSYHNNNRLHLPHDPALQRSLHLALRRDDHDIDSKRSPHEDADEGDHDHDAETDDYEDYQENHSPRAFVVTGNSSKRMKPRQGLEEINFGDPQSLKDFRKGTELQLQNEVHPPFPEGDKASWLHKQWFKSRSIELEEKKLQIESEMLELEKEQFKWQRFSKKKELELERLKMENDRMRLENDRKALELRRMELNINCNT
ncbi:hypothetical protein vseg_009066 [Gypsophila vaccaria]